MKQRDVAEVSAWWMLAVSDLRVATELAGLQPSEPHQVCFHCQQVPLAH